MGVYPIFFKRGSFLDSATLNSIISRAHDTRKEKCKNSPIPPFSKTPQLLSEYSMTQTTRFRHLEPFISSHTRRVAASPRVLASYESMNFKPRKGYKTGGGGGRMTVGKALRK